MFQEFRLEPIINAKMPSLRWLCYGSAVDAAEMLKRGYTRETDIRRDRAGRWYQGDELITHDNLVRSFASWIDRAPDGRFCLRNDIHWVYATIEGPPYFVRSASLDGERLVLKLSGDRQEALDTGTLRVGPDDAVWCDVLQGRVPARFDNHAITQLAEVVGEDAQGLFLQIGAEVFAAACGRPHGRLGSLERARGVVRTRAQDEEPRRRLTPGLFAFGRCGARRVSRR